MRGEAGIVEQVRAVAERVAQGYGLDIFDVEFRREGPGMIEVFTMERIAVTA